MAFKSEATRFDQYLIYSFYHSLILMLHSLMAMFLCLLQQGFCFGFVEFETLSSMQNALEVLLYSSSLSLFKFLNVIANILSYPF